MVYRACQRSDEFWIRGANDERDVAAHHLRRLAQREVVLHRRARVEEGFTPRIFGDTDHLGASCGHLPLVNMETLSDGIFAWPEYARHLRADHRVERASFVGRLESAAAHDSRSHRPEELVGDPN